MDTTDIPSEKVRWILEQILEIVGDTMRGLIDCFPDGHLSIHSVRRVLTEDVRPKLGMLSEETLQRIGSYGLGLGNDGCWELGVDEFLEQTTLEEAGLMLKAGMSGNEFLREMAFTTIVAITWDILNQEKYRGEENRRRHSYALI